MSEQQAPPVDTPEPVDTPVLGTDTQEQPNWEERYKEAQAWGTQNAQRAADLERYEQAVEALRSEDPQAREWAAQALGIELLAEEENDEQFVDPTEQLAQEVAQVKATLEQRQQFEQQQAQETRDLGVIGEGLKAVEKKLGIELSPEEIGILGDAAWVNRDEQGLPNIAAVAAAYGVILESRAPKPRPKAPHFSAVGQAGTQVPDLSTHDGKVDHIMSRLNADQ